MLTRQSANSLDCSEKSTPRDYNPTHSPLIPSIRSRSGAGGGGRKQHRDSQSVDGAKRMRPFISWGNVRAPDPSGFQSRSTPAGREGRKHGYDPKGGREGGRRSSPTCTDETFDPSPSVGGKYADGDDNCAEVEGVCDHRWFDREMAEQMAPWRELRKNPILQ